MVSSKQRAHVDQRIEFTCVVNSMQDTYRGKVVNLHAAIRLAFVLGTRFGLAQPAVAGDFMARWLNDHTLDTDVGELAVRHQRALAACTYPLEYTAEEYADMEGDEDE